LLADPVIIDPNRTTEAARTTAYSRARVLGPFGCLALGPFIFAPRRDRKKQRDEYAGPEHLAQFNPGSPEQIVFYSP